MHQQVPKGQSVVLLNKGQQLQQEHALSQQPLQAEYTHPLKVLATVPLFDGATFDADYNCRDIINVTTLEVCCMAAALCLHL